jgi:methylmalonyl-CoA mutase C-terminal domain/subunit
VKDKHPLKAVVAKIGLDGHYRGVKFVAQTLTREGVEVVYLGANQHVTDVVNAVVQEDAQLVALSFLSPDYRQHVPQLLTALHAAGARDVVVVVGGLIAAEDVGPLQAAGVRRIFGPGTTSQQIAEFLLEVFPAHEAAKSA